MKLKEAFVGYKIAKLADGYSPNTLNGYQTHFDQLHDRFGDVEIENITGEQLKKFMVWLRHDYKPQRQSGDTRPYKSTTIRNAWCAVRSLFGWASQELGFERPDLDLKMPKVNYPDISPFTKEEIQALLKACKYSKEVVTKDNRRYRMRRPTALRDRLIILVLLDTGIRVSECCNLLVEDVNLENCEIFIRPLTTSRKNRSRTLRIGTATQRTMWKYLEKRKDKYPHDPVFLTQHNRLMDRSSIRHLLKRISINAGVDNVYPHRFRHTFAIQFIRNGGDVFSLQLALGHSDWTMTRHYANLAKRDLANSHRRASPVDNWRL